ncbi:MAG: hypothetical protein QM489_00810 [Candidatus Izemoplasma sp.]
MKNYMSINDSIILSPGHRIETRAIQGSFLSWATIDEEIPTLFPMHKLSDFMAAMSLFNDPELTFEENTCTISDGKSKIPYLSSMSRLVNNKPLEDLGTPEFELEFKITNDQLSYIMKAASSLGHDSMICSVNLETNLIEMSTINSKANLNVRNDFFTTLGEPTVNEFQNPITAIFDVNLLKIIPGDYEVSISKTGCARLVNPELQVTYMIGLLHKSKF